MARFMIRVELHEAEHGDATYEHLHEQMDLAGFERTILVGAIRQKLPPAEYTIKLDEPIENKAVYEMVEKAAKKALKLSELDTKPAIVVAKLVGGFFVGGLQAEDA